MSKKTKLFLLIGFVALLEVFSWFWIPLRERGSQDLKFALKAGLKNTELKNLKESRTADLLAYDHAYQLIIPGECKVELYLVSYSEGNARGLMDVFGHSPEVCLPTSGASLVGEVQTQSINIAETDFTLDIWQFSHPLVSGPIYSFKVVLSEDPKLISLAMERKYKELRVLLAKQRKPIPSIQFIVGNVYDATSFQEAAKVFESSLKSSLHHSITKHDG